MWSPERREHWTDRSKHEKKTPFQEREEKGRNASFASREKGRTQEEVLHAKLRGERLLLLDVKEEGVGSAHAKRQGGERNGSARRSYKLISGMRTK